MMNLWLLRHGEAEPTQTSDIARNLTGTGVQEVLKTAQRLRKVPLDIVLHSPYVRALQTAQIVCEEIAYQGEIAQVEWITPDDNPKQVIKQLEAYEAENILLVSHQPLLGKLVGLLTEGELMGASYYLATAELVHLEGVTICLAGMDVKK